MLVSLDTETTGTDLRHGARPFFVTFGHEDRSNTYFEWDVNPTNRSVKVVPNDVKLLLGIIDQADEIVLQNAKFDVRALATIIPNLEWPWHKTHDTLLAGHLLASNHPHDLTSMAVEYLSLDITPYETTLEEAVKKCRNLVRRKNSPLRQWKIAGKDVDGMPSAKATVWKYDSWLPRAVALDSAKSSLFDVSPEGYLTVLADYSNCDSAVTLMLWQEQEKLLRKRGLWEIYQSRRQLLPVVYAMESIGVTCSLQRLNELQTKYATESERLGRVCRCIATSYGRELELPKSGNSKSLTDFVFNDLKLPAIRTSKKTGAPSLDKSCLEEYATTLPERSKQKLFIESLRAKRRADTAISYLESYQRFMLPLQNGQGVVPNWFTLYPSLNTTGTDTLRFSSNNPNEQNISKQEGFNLRYAFGPAPGREWWSLDAKNIELRIPAYESEQQELIDLFERPDEPPYYGSTHLLNFHTVYSDIWESELATVGLDKVGPHCKKKYAASWYQWCKNGNFAVQYGAIERKDRIGTADRAFHRVGSHAKLKARFDKLESLNQYWIKYADRHGYVETLPDKSVDPKRGYPLLCTRSQYGGILPTVPLNYHVQGTAMWWMSRAMVRCCEFLADNRSNAYIVMQVHDELVFDFPKGRGARPWLTNLPIVKQLAALMAKGGEDIGVPTPVGIEYNANNWSEGMTVE